MLLQILFNLDSTYQSKQLLPLETSTLQWNEMYISIIAIYHQGSQTALKSIHILFLSCQLLFSYRSLATENPHWGFSFHTITFDIAHQFGCPRKQSLQAGFWFPDVLSSCSEGSHQWSAWQDLEFCRSRASEDAWERLPNLSYLRWEGLPCMWVKPSHGLESQTASEESTSVHLSLLPACWCTEQRHQQAGSKLRLPWLPLHDRWHLETVRKKKKRNPSLNCLCQGILSQQ